MCRTAGFLILALLGCLFIGDGATAGAREGKIRWTARQTGMCKWFPAIKVPELSSGKPGLVEIKLVFKAKEQAEFFIIGDGDTGLELVVRDSKKEVVKDSDLSVRDGTGSDLRVCRWIPEREEEFTIQIYNWGKVYNVVQAGCN